MDPHVYPDPQIAPLTLPLAAGMVAPTFTPIEAIGGDRCSDTGVKTMFIRIAMSGAPVATVVSPTAPSVFVRADTGDAVLLNDAGGFTKPIYKAPGTGLADYAADGQVMLEPGLDNVFRVTVTFTTS